MITEDLIKYDSLEKCLEQFETIIYECYSNPFIFLTFNYTTKEYSIVFRNPVEYILFANEHNNINNDKSPLKVCHNTIDFINNNKQHFSYVK